MALPPLFLIGVVVGGVAVLMNIISLATDEWVTASNSNEGLFETCIGNKCFEMKNEPDEIEATRAMVIMGVIAGIVGVALAAIFTILQVMGKSATKIIFYVAVLGCFAATVLNILGVIIYGAKYYDDLPDSVDLGYSFALCIVGALLYAVGGILLFLGGKSMS